MQVRNPGAMRLLIGWIAVAAVTLGGLMLAGFGPPHPGFQAIFVPAMLAVLVQGVAAMMAAKRGAVRLGWWILLLPVGLTLLLVLTFFVLFAIGTTR